MGDEDGSQRGKRMKKSFYGKKVTGCVGMREGLRFQRDGLWHDLSKNPSTLDFRP